MSTINDTEIIHTMLRNKGVYPGDPRPPKYIYTYINAWGGKTYKVYERPLHATDYVHEPVLLMKDGKLTIAGEIELAGCSEYLCQKVHSGQTLMETYTIFRHDKERSSIQCSGGSNDDYRDSY